ncbi:TIGR04086 family membrane protein [Clostridium sp. SHJSY1]|uniref:TIGR04086 family membrane protein n=1 Tax=Clostridium sp. SHJSY1 TaxID=2942483 RepID=UPI002875AAA4|nr:TIGR04086 family membrane protein [Clostridium sp. SHJSY1]MDS0524421.1 TIGR04086 family membrane protein [Clostridium sp. SHJSY1]
MKRYIKNVIKGSLLSTVLCIILIFFLSLVMIKVDFAKSIYIVIYYVITLTSLAVGGIITAKVNERKGWLSGALVGILFFILMLVFSSIFKEDSIMGSGELYKLLIYAIIGAISGILGVNI